MIGPLIQRIRCGHGDSLRDAAAKAGMDYSVLRRLERDLPIRNRSAVLEAFATAYGLNPDKLDKEDSARASFRASLAAMDEGARIAHARAPFERRALVALDWGVSADVDENRVAGAAGVIRQEVTVFRSACPRGRADRETARRLAAALVALLNIPPHWFNAGVSPSETGVDGWAHLLQAAVDLAQKARPALAGRQRLTPVRHLHEALQRL